MAGIDTDKFAALINELSEGFRAAQVLCTAQRVDLFRTLAAAPLTSEELAQRMDCSERGTRILCNALSALGLLRKKDGRYSNTGAGLAALASGTTQDLAAVLKHRAYLYERWGTLYDVVKTGKPAADEAIDPRVVLSEQDFARSMAGNSRLLSVETAKALDLAAAATMLDIGGGPGLYAIEFARKNPDLRVTILDRPGTLEIARENIRAAGLENRITLHAGDLAAGSLPAGFDFVFVSNIIHMMSAEENNLFTDRCCRCLNPGGLLCIKDFLLDSSRTAPRQAALFAVNMLVNTEKGDCYTAAQVQHWFTAAGLTRLQVIPLTAPNAMVLGVNEK